MKDSKGNRHSWRQNLSDWHPNIAPQAPETKPAYEKITCIKSKRGRGYNKKSDFTFSHETGKYTRKLWNSVILLFSK